MNACYISPPFKFFEILRDDVNGVLGEKATFIQVKMTNLRRVLAQNTGSKCLKSDLRFVVYKHPCMEVVL